VIVGTEGREIKEEEGEGVRVIGIFGGVGGS
jgi:hypothetical protein